VKLFKMMETDMAVTEYCVASSFDPSERSTLRKFTLSLSFARPSKTGLMAWQGGHQLAVKSMTCKQTVLSLELGQMRTQIFTVSLLASPVNSLSCADVEISATIMRLDEVCDVRD